MERYRKMLVAVDGSASSSNAFRQACRIAKDDRSWVTVLTTIPLYQDQFEVLSTREKVTRDLRAQAERIITDIAGLAKTIDCFIKTRIEEGNPSDTIVDVADENNFDLIVMGRRGRRQLEKALVGSVTARVIGHSQRDVLVVPQAGTIDWATILLTTDGSRYSRMAAEKAIALARSYRGALKIVSVVDVTDEFYSEAPDLTDEMVGKAHAYVNEDKERAEAQGVNAEAFVREGEAHEVINGLAQKLGAGVIVMGSHGRTGVRRLLMGSITEKVIGYAKCPVLIVKA